MNAFSNIKQAVSLSGYQFQFRYLVISSSRNFAKKPLQSLYNPTRSIMPRQHASRPVLQLLAIALLALLSVAAADTKSYGPTPTNNRKVCARWRVDTRLEHRQRAKIGTSGSGPAGPAGGQHMLHRHCLCWQHMSLSNDIVRDSSLPVQLLSH